MPLLSRLFGRKHQDDDKTPAAEGPLSDQSFDVAPFVPYKPPADTAEVELGSKQARSEAEEADGEAIPREPERAESAADPLAAVATLPEDDPAHPLNRADREDADGASESQDPPLEPGEELLEVLGTNGSHDVSSNGSGAAPEMSPDPFSPPANQPDHDTDQPSGVGSDRFGPLSKESAEAFAASIGPVDTLPLETADRLARPESTPSAPFNALAAASADAFEMPIEEIADPFGPPSDKLPEPAAREKSGSAGTLFKSQAARSNPFMKLVAEAHEGAEGSDSSALAEAEPASLPVTSGKRLDLMQPGQDSGRLTTFVVPPAGTEPHTLIGGKEDDLVPLIPDTEADEADEAAGAEIDESGIAEAAVTSLKGACDFLVVRVKKLSAQQDGTRVVAGLIALVGELDARYALDMGIRRRNGVEELLIDVRGRMAEGDRFILESLENGRGGLTADPFLRDLKTIAPSDRPRMLGHYVVFLTFMVKRVLHQYLRSLEEDQTRTYEISYRLDYLVEGVRDMLMSKVSAGAS